MKDLKFLGTSTGDYYGDLNDINYDVNGNVRMVAGIEYARQAITKILLTQSGTGPFPSYGTDLPSIIRSSQSPEKMQQTIQDSVLFAVTYYNETTSADALPSESVETVESIDVQFQGTDTIEVTAVFIMGDGAPLRIVLGN